MVQSPRFDHRDESSPLLPSLLESSRVAETLWRRHPATKAACGHCSFGPIRTAQPRSPVTELTPAARRLIACAAILAGASHFDGRAGVDAGGFTPWQLRLSYLRSSPCPPSSWDSTTSFVSGRRLASDEPRSSHISALSADPGGTRCAPALNRREPRRRGARPHRPARAGFEHRRARTSASRGGG